ncbi:hypothetical protein BDV95DRAFT_611762 [Massariosphaeria phaeospora]|uniref:Uncharacterized protein n=1 Tax=Massariosphaeria phaeospora TaxID=100035 RepID=A0A7C8M2J3_9PLEO|nr:hypothetical protein BDV95DRAFT_611762 [Massariosphaeria phaeospora]
MALARRSARNLRVSLLIVSLSLPFVYGGDLTFSREDCLEKTRNLLTDGLLATNDTCFRRDDKGAPYSSLEDPQLTLSGCNKICGPSFGWYKDIGPRLSIWLIPVFLLLSNMEVSPLDKRRYLMIVHLLGDPIDSLRCLLAKMEAWSRCYYMALKFYGPNNTRQVRNVATVLGGIEELVGFHTNPMDVYTTIMAQSKLTSPQFDILVSRTAQQLADSRTDERLRTIFATTLYIYQLVSAFVTTVGGGGSKTPPGGRIGITMFMTWIVPSILLSNAIGGFTSHRTCFCFLESFVQDATTETDLWSLLQRTSVGLRCHRTIDQYLDSLAWSGAIYSYRPSKHIPFRSGPRDRSRYTLLFLSIAPVVISSTIATLILRNTPPISFNCRNFLIFGIVAFVFLSAILTSLTARLCLKAATHWRVVLVKDALIAMPMVILVFFATSGLFNSCWCWSGVYAFGELAHVPLNTLPQFSYYNKTIYPILVAVCLALQVLVFAAMMWIGWGGWITMRWSEEDKKLEWMECRQRARNGSLKTT